PTHWIPLARVPPRGLQEVAKTLGRIKRVVRRRSPARPARVIAGESPDPPSRVILSREATKGSLSSQGFYGRGAKAILRSLRSHQDDARGDAQDDARGDAQDDARGGRAQHGLPLTIVAGKGGVGK